MTRETYRQALDDLQNDVSEMGDIVVERLDMGLESVANCHERLAREVVEGDEDVNETYLALENRCPDLFALQQPVAGDLRIVTASFEIITDLERIGGHAVNIAAWALYTTENDSSPLY